MCCAGIRLTRNFDRFPGGGVTAGTGLAFHDHEFAKSGNGEARAGLFVGELDQLVQNGIHVFLGQFGRVGALMICVLVRGLSAIGVFLRKGCYT